MTLHLSLVFSLLKVLATCLSGNTTWDEILRVNLLLFPCLAYHHTSAVGVWNRIFEFWWEKYYSRGVCFAL